MVAKHNSCCSRLIVTVLTPSSVQKFRSGRHCRASSVHPFHPALLPAPGQRSPMTAERSDATAPDSVTGNPGPRVRRLRTDRGMGLRELASLTGTTPSFISQFERGESGASIATLVRIAEALGINLADLFTQQTSAGRVTRLGRHPAIQSAGYRKILLTPPPLQAIEGYRLEFDEGEGTGAAGRQHQRESQPAQHPP